MKKYPKHKDSGVQWIGQIPEHWKIGKIKVLCDSIFAGATPSTDNQEYWEGGSIPWIPSGCCHDCKINEAPKYITEAGLQNSSTKLIPANTTVMALTGATCAQLGYLTIEACANQSVVAFVENKQKADSRFLYYSLFAAREEILTHKSGGAQGGINQKDCRNTQIAVIPLFEQQAIVNYLDKKTGQIDKSISLLETQKADLQAYRKAIISETVTKGLNPNAKLKDSGIQWIGQIPEEWSVSKLKYAGEARNGLTYSPDDICDAGILVLRSSNIQDSRLDFNDNVYVGSAPDTLKMQQGDILICSRNGSIALVGKCAYIPNDMDAVFGAFMMRFRPKCANRFMFYVVQEAIQSYKAYYATSTVNQLTVDVFGNMQIPLPSRIEQEAIANYLDKKTSDIDTAIERINAQITELQAYRTAFISEAVTGKIDVRP